MSQALITIKQLSKSFSGGEIQVFKDLSLSIEAGDIFGIIGESGAGKSTLVRCLNLLEEPDSGDIIFDGLNMGQLTHKELLTARQSMGMIFQQFNLLMQRSVLANVTFPMEIAGIDKKTARKKALDLLGLVGLSDKADTYPSRLSGGQKQRVAIARALANDPKVLLCDEATSALDPVTTKDILSLLKDINEKLNLTIIIITHEMDVVEQICNRVVVLDQQGIAESGTVKEVFFAPKSETARKFIYTHNPTITKPDGAKLIRLVFDGRSSFEPVIGDMVLRFKQPVNIIYANTKDIGGTAYGEMLLQLPEDTDTAEKMIFYLREKGHQIEEVAKHE